MDPVDMLIDGAMQHEVLLNRNPYLTMETIILRLYKKISERTGVTFNQFDKTVLFSRWHDEILNAYQSLKSNMSHEEKASVERVLSKDSPHPSELTKFACCWYKHDPSTACRWFAVDGIIASHPKSYVQEAFSENFEKHNSAVRTLYAYYSSPEAVKLIVGKALAIQEEENCPSDFDSDLSTCVGVYAGMVGEEEMKRVASDRQSKLQAQQQPSKRKKKTTRPQSPRPASPTFSPRDFTEPERDLYSERDDEEDASTKGGKIKSQQPIKRKKKTISPPSSVSPTEEPRNSTDRHFKKEDGEVSKASKTGKFKSSTTHSVKNNKKFRPPSPQHGSSSAVSSRNSYTDGKDSSEVDDPSRVKSSDRSIKHKTKIRSPSPQPISPADSPLLDYGDFVFEKDDDEIEKATKKWQAQISDSIKTPD